MAAGTELEACGDVEALALIRLRPHTVGALESVDPHASGLAIDFPTDRGRGERTGRLEPRSLPDLPAAARTGEFRAAVGVAF